MATSGQQFSTTSGIIMPLPGGRPLSPCCALPSAPVPHNSHCGMSSLRPCRTVVGGAPGSGSMRPKTDSPRGHGESQAAIEASRMSRLKCSITDASQNTFLQRHNPPPQVSPRWTGWNVNTKNELSLKGNVTGQWSRPGSGDHPAPSPHSAQIICLHIKHRLIGTSNNPFRRMGSGCRLHSFPTFAG